MRSVLLLLAVACSIVAGCVAASVERPPSATDRKIQALIDSMQRENDPLHLDYNGPVYDLIAIGKPAVPKLVALMENADETTRIRAQTVLNGIVMTDLGFRFGQGWGARDRSKEANQLIASLGRLDDAMSDEERHMSAKRWREWALPENDRPDRGGD